MAADLRPEERRRAPRQCAPRFGVADVALIRPGLAVSVVTISSLGARVESLSPIRPGARTELTLDSPDGRRWPVGVVVLRCWVAALGPVRYHAAMRFDSPIAEGSG
ncbi:MAG: hypothetical protein KA371_17830 [Acidobacteria bacterium]|nr:hypothetical protein [Acidobacteriota bacterium]